MKPSMLKTALALAAATIGLALFAYSCASTQQVNTSSSGGISITLTTDKRVYEIGEEVAITAKARNNSSEPYGYCHLLVTDAIEISVRSTDLPYSMCVFLRENGTVSPCRSHELEPWTFGKLAAGDSLLIKASWDQNLYKVDYSAPSTDVYTAETGEYMITALFGPGVLRYGHYVAAKLTVEIR